MCPVLDQSEEGRVAATFGPESAHTTQYLSGRRTDNNVSRFLNNLGGKTVLQTRSLSVSSVTTRLEV